MDLGLSPDPYECFRLFQKRILGQYQGMIEEFGLTAIDAIQPLVYQQQQVRTLVDAAPAQRAARQPVALARGACEGRALRPLPEPGPT